MGWVWGHGDDLTESETIHMTKSVEVSSPRHSCSSHLSSQDLGGASAGCPCCCSHFLLHDSRCISKAHSDPLLTYRKKNVAFNSCEHCCVTLIQNEKWKETVLFQIYYIGGGKAISKPRQNTRLSSNILCDEQKQERGWNGWHFTMKIGRNHWKYMKYSNTNIKPFW